MKYVRCDSHCKYPAYTQEETDIMINETKQYAKEYTDNISQPEVMTLKLDATHTLLNDEKYEKLNIVEADKVGSSLSVEDGQIIIGAGINNIVIEYDSNLIPETTGLKFASLFKNGDGEPLIISNNYGTSSQRTHIAHIRRLLSVEEGDYFELKVFGKTGDVFEKNRTYITIEKIN